MLCWTFAAALTEVAAEGVKIRLNNFVEQCPTYDLGKATAPDLT